MPKPLKMRGNAQIHVAIPAMDELELLPKCLDGLAGQDCENFDVWVCVNQPEDWWDDSERRAICESNQQLLAWLATYKDLPIHVVDRSSRGNGWLSGKGGVGRARKTVMDQICESSDASDVIVCIDADTLCDSTYLSAVIQAFEKAPQAYALSAPYYHSLTQDDLLDRAILRYECWLRYFAINLWRIKSPYAFTAMGSAMAVPVWAYQKVGGMPPREAAEDFYFLQNLRKRGPLIHWCDARVYPSARLSGRVPFGTGAAMTTGMTRNWSSYPFVRAEGFDDVEQTVNCFPALYEKDMETPLSVFLREQLNVDDPWGPLRKNHSRLDRFVRACHERLDGLRIFQYLRSSYVQRIEDECSGVIAYLRRYHAGSVDGMDDICEPLSFETSSVEELNKLRDVLVKVEEGQGGRESMG